MKKIFLYIAIAFLFLPLIQENFKIAPAGDLFGSFTSAKKADFSWEVWMNSSYQKQQEEYLNENFGFRTFLIKLYNEYRFRLFKLSTNKEAVFGKNNVFFAEDYILSYVGKDYAGHEYISAKAKAVKQLQDKLQSLNITFIPVFAPNKARFYKNDIPNSYLPASISNYEDMSKSFREIGIKHIDFNKAFEKEINTSPYPLFAQYGIHWSTYAHALATDSILKYIEKERQIELPKMIWKDNLTLSDTLRELDYDIGRTMNLLTSQLPTYKMAYPTYSFINKEKKHPSVMVIGDSFYFGMEQTGVQEEIFSNHLFLYYFNEVKTFKKFDKEAFSKLDIKNEIKNHEVIILICTEHNLDTYGWGFIEQANKLLEN
jgi:hypothetical protein